MIDIAIMREDLSSVRFSEAIRYANPLIQKRALLIYSEAVTLGLLCPYIEECFFNYLAMSYHEDQRFLYIYLRDDCKIISYRTSMCKDKIISVERTDDQIRSFMKIFANYLNNGDSL